MKAMKLSTPHDAYSAIADEYAAKVETKAHNAFYDRPAVQSLVPKVQGSRILDAGCGPGVYSQWLVDQGAVVTAIDANQAMVHHAQKRLGSRVSIYQANLEQPLDFLENKSFHGVLSALTISYIQDLEAPFREFARILRPGGWFIFSTEHPFFTYNYHSLSRYRETQALKTPWKGFETEVVMPSFHHSLETLSSALTEAGFVIELLSEAMPSDDFAKVEPERYERIARFPLFLFFRARLDQPRRS